MALEAEALQLARRAGDIHATAHVLASLADHALRDRDDLATADALLRESLTLRQSLTGGRQSRFIAMTLEGLARHALGQGAPERCARLFGAADALRVAIGVPIAPFYQPISDQAMAGAQHLLGRERWERAWSEGHALSTDDAIAYALEEARPELDETAQAAPSTTAIAGLSPRELDVLRLLVDGRSNQEIAAALFISPRTTANHVANIMNKLGLDSRTAVATWAVRQGIE
jgi:DNA-binding CsgD family transcriptional regulator